MMKAELKAAIAHMTREQLEDAFKLCLVALAEGLAEREDLSHAYAPLRPNATRRLNAINAATEERYERTAGLPDVGVLH